MSVWDELADTKGDERKVRPYLEVMMMLILGDGQSDPSEVQRAVDLMNNHPRISESIANLSNQDRRRLLIDVQRDIKVEGVDERIRKLANRIPSQKGRAAALEMAVAIAFADGMVESGEISVLKKLQRAFEISDETAREIVQPYRK